MSRFLRSVAKRKSLTPLCSGKQETYCQLDLLRRAAAADITLEWGNGSSLQVRRIGVMKLRARRLFDRRYTSSKPRNTFLIYVNT